MPYKIIKLQNQSDFPNNPMPTQSVTEKDEGWDAAYANWIAGKPPLGWGNNVVAITEELPSKQHEPVKPVDEIGRPNKTPENFVSHMEKTYDIVSTVFWAIIIAGLMLLLALGR